MIEKKVINKVIPKKIFKEFFINEFPSIYLAVIIPPVK